MKIICKDENEERNCNYRGNILLPNVTPPTAEVTEWDKDHE
jgi:hypothetical protein